MDDYKNLIRAARKRLDVQVRTPRPDLGGDEVQLSVRVPAGLRAATAEVAARRGQTVTAFVSEVLERAVLAETDPFVGLAADLAAHTRAALADAVDDGAYAAAAGKIDAAEQGSAAS